MLIAVVLSSIMLNAVLLLCLMLGVIMLSAERNYAKFC
jgi:hypothetical protein